MIWSRTDELLCFLIVLWSIHFPSHSTNTVILRLAMILVWVRNSFLDLDGFIDWSSVLGDALRKTLPMSLASPWSGLTEVPTSHWTGPFGRVQLFDPESNLRPVQSDSIFQFINYCVKLVESTKSRKRWNCLDGLVKSSNYFDSKGWTWGPMDSIKSHADVLDYHQEAGWCQTSSWRISRPTTKQQFT